MIHSMQPVMHPTRSMMASPIQATMPPTHEKMTLWDHEQVSARASLQRSRTRDYLTPWLTLKATGVACKPLPPSFI
jgi:hypothetical protein